MPLYSYTARDADGRVKQGLKEGQTQEEILAALQSGGLLVTQIVEVGEIGKPKKKGRRRKRHTNIKLTDLILATRQLATLVGAGVTLLRSIEVILHQISSNRLQKVFELVREDIRAGQPFYAALAKHPKIFSSFFVNLVRTGEAGGHLAQALDQLASYLENEEKIRNKVISAMIYPVILIGMSILIISAFLLKIVPIFTELFRNFGIELPGLTKAVIVASEFLQTQFLLLVGIIVGAVFFFRAVRASRQGRLVWDHVTLKLPILGDLTRDSAVSDFAKGLGTLIRSGVPILYALDIVAKSARNSLVQRLLEDVRMEVREGRSIAEPLSAGDIFDPIVIQMVRVGEEIGELGSMLEKVGIFYDEQIERTTERLVSLIEPLAIVVMGVVIGLLVISMYMPIFSVTQLGGG